MMVSYMIMLVMSEPFSVCESMPRDVHTVLKSQCMTVFAALLQLSVETQGMVKKEQSPLLMSSAEVRQSSALPFQCTFIWNLGMGSAVYLALRCLFADNFTVQNSPQL